MPEIPSDELLPTPPQLGAVMRSRTTTARDNELGTFTDATRPTADEATQALRDAMIDVGLELGPTVPDRYVDAVQLKIAYLAAHRIEISFFREQNEGNTNAAAAHLADYERGLEQLVVACRKGLGATPRGPRMRTQRVRSSTASFFTE